MTTVSPGYSSSWLQDVFGFPFRDPRWQSKLVVGALFSLGNFVVPLLPAVFLLGYQAAVARQAIQDGRLHLPEWAGWDRLFRDGLRLLGVGLIYALPIIGMYILGFGLMIGTSLFTAFLEQAGDEAIALFMWLAFAGSLGGVALFGLALLLAAVVGAVLPAAIMHVIATDDFMAAFRVAEWWRLLRANLAGFVLAYLVVMGAALLLGFAMQVLYLTLVLCCLVPFLAIGTSVYLGLVWSAANGLAYREAVAKS